MQGAISALNHVLSGESWARQRLRPFAGRHVRVAAGPVSVTVVVEDEGFFRQPAKAVESLQPDVTIELPPDTPFRVLLDRQSVFAAAKLSGSADFAETLAVVFRNLRWDVEEDLSRFVGDVLAHRLVRSGKALFAWQRQASVNAVVNVAEYFSEEARILVTKKDFGGFTRDIDELVRDLSRLDGRLGRLKG